MTFELLKNIVQKKHSTPLLMKQVVLDGVPGAGKSTIMLALSKALHKHFPDHTIYKNHNLRIGAEQEGVRELTNFMEERYTPGIREKKLLKNSTVGLTLLYNDILFKCGLDSRVDDKIISLVERNAASAFGIFLYGTWKHLRPSGATGQESWEDFVTIRDNVKPIITFSNSEKMNVKETLVIWIDIPKEIAHKRVMVRGDKHELIGYDKEYARVMDDAHAAYCTGTGDLIDSGFMSPLTEFYPPGTVSVLRLGVGAEKTVEKLIEEIEEHALFRSFVKEA